MFGMRVTLIAKLYLRTKFTCQANKMQTASKTKNKNKNKTKQNGNFKTIKEI